MAERAPSEYGDRIARFYDEWYVGEPDTEGAVTAIAELAGSGPVLELGIGTGRLAVPLARRGIVVHGIDASAAMVDRLHRKAGGESIPVTVGSFAMIERAERYSLIFAAFSTFFCLTTQDQQIDCFKSIVDHLVPDGLVAVEAFIFDGARFTRHQRVDVGRIDPDGLVLEAAEVDVPRQRLRYHHVIVSDAGNLLVPVSLRFASPAELDLMARLAGLRLRHRWANWRRSPLTRDSTHHVSVYERAEDAG